MGQRKESKVAVYNNGQGINIHLSSLYTSLQLSGDNLLITSQHTGGVQPADPAPSATMTT